MHTMRVPLRTLSCSGVRCSRPPVSWSVQKSTFRHPAEFGVCCSAHFPEGNFGPPASSPSTLAAR
eukprot:6393941-Alexandrium_andersonii.AAC.1